MWGWDQEQQTHFTRAFDSHKIMVIETFRALNKLMFFEYQSNEVNLRKQKNHFENSRGQKRVY